MVSQMIQLEIEQLSVEELRAALDGVPSVPNDTSARLEALARLACEADEPKHARTLLAPQGLAADFEVLLIAVEVACRRRGIGRELLEAALESEAKGARWVLGTGNAPATERFYRAAAWEPAGLEPGYFERAYGHEVFEGDTRLTARSYFMKTAPQA